MAEELSPGAIEDGELTKDQILDLLGDDDPGKEEEKEVEKEEEKEEEKEVKEEKDEEKDEKEIELKDEEDDEDKKPKEDELDLITPVRRQEILAKYPKVFKDFPYLEKAFYRDKDYTELFGTVDDAKEASEKAGTLDNYEQELMDGSIESVLTAVKDNDSGAFNKIADTYLETLSKVDTKAYQHVVSGMVNKLITGMAGEAKRVDNKQLQAAAQLVNQFVFGTSDFKPTERLTRGPDEGDSKLARERREFNEQRFETVRDDLSTRIGNQLKSTISGYIDPKEVMTSYVRRNAIRDSMEQVEGVIDQDDRFGKILDGLWKKAAAANYSPATVNKIRSTYLSKAKTLLPSVIRKSRDEALKGLGKKSGDDKHRSSETRDRRHLSDKSSTKGSSKDGRGMSTLEFFNQD